MLNPEQIKNVKVGDRVGFKRDVEQSSKVLEIKTEHGVTFFKVNVTQGEYGQGEKWIEAARCW